MKKEYIRPEMFIVILGDDLLQVITQGSDTNDFAKENPIDVGFVDDEEPLPEDKDLWGDDEEEE